MHNTHHRAIRIRVDKKDLPPLKYHYNNYKKHIIYKLFLKRNEYYTH